MPDQHLKSIRKKFSNQLGIIPIPLIIGAILVITAAAASIPVTYIINQTSQDTRSKAGICCEAGSCNDGWSYGRDENAPQATCEQRQQEACANRGGPASGGGSCSGGGGGGGSPSCVYSDFCGGCIQANRCLQYSDGTKKYCNQWIDQECQQAGCCGNGVFCPSGQNCCPGQGLIKCPNGRCGTTCQAPTSTPTPTSTPIPSGTQCSGNQKECANLTSFKVCTNGYWSSSISCSSLDPSKPKCVDGTCISATAPDGHKTNLANCTTPCSDADGCICKADNCVTPKDETITSGTCGVAPPTSCDGGIAPGNCNASGRICVVGVINNTPYASFQPPPQGKVCQGVNQPPVDAPTCVPPNNSINPSTQQCCSGSPQLMPAWGTGYFCIETSPPPPNSPTATISPSPSPTATWTPTPSASITISPTATWTPIPIQTPPPPTITPPTSCDGGIAPGNCNSAGKICVVGVINNTPYASFQPPPQGKVCQGVNQPPVSVTVTATAAPSPPVTVSPTLSPTATAAPTTAGCIADGGYWYPGLTCCSGQSHASFSGDTICGSPPTTTPTPAPAIITAIQQVAQAVTTTVAQVATTIWNWITGTTSQTTPAPSPSPAPTAAPTSQITAAPPPPTNNPTATISPSPSPTITPPANCDGGIAPGNCNASGRICVVGVINNTPYASFQPPPQGKVCQGVNQPPVSVTVTATAAPSPPVTVSPTPQFTLTLTQNNLMSYCVEQYGTQYSLLPTPNGYYCSYYDGQRTHQYRIDPSSICQDLTGNPSAVAVPFENQYRCVVN